MNFQEQFEQDVMAKVAEKLAGVAIPKTKGMQDAIAQLMKRQQGSARETIVGALKGQASGSVAPVPIAKPRPASKITAEGLRDTNPLME